jgi:hypothetical protein
MKKLTTLIGLIISLSWAACSTGEQSASNSQTSNAQPVTLETVQADETLHQWVLAEEAKANERLKLGGSGPGGLRRTRVISVENRGSTAEASFNFQTMQMFVDGDSVKGLSGSGTATFEHKNGKWFLIKVASPGANFVRDNLMVEVN